MASAQLYFSSEIDHFIGETRLCAIVSIEKLQGVMFV